MMKWSEVRYIISKFNPFELLYAEQMLQVIHQLVPHQKQQKKRNYKKIDRDIRHYFDCAAKAKFSGRPYFRFNHVFREWIHKQQAAHNHSPSTSIVFQRTPAPYAFCCRFFLRCQMRVPTIASPHSNLMNCLRFRANECHWQTIITRYCSITYNRKPS